MHAIMRNIIPVLAVFLTGAGPAGAVDVTVVALTQGKAVLVIDGGRPRTLAVGDVTPENVKLLSSNSEEAVVEVDGQRRALRLGTAISINTSPGGQQQATLTADTRGHFFATATVNGVSVRFLVDTGASMVTLSAADATRAGVLYRSGQRARVQTANGPADAWRVKLDAVRLGPITLTNVDGLVIEGDALAGVGLLGMSFLNRTEMQRDGERMTLKRRY
jgi:aspartyl protease family protein